MDGLEHEGNIPVPQGLSAHVPHQSETGSERAWLRSSSGLSPGSDEPGEVAEEVLVVQAEGGDDEAFGHLCERYRGAIHRYIRRLIKDDAIASELTQETFLKAWQSLPMRDQKRALHFRPWVYRIAYTTTIDHLRKYPPEQHPLPLERTGEKGTKRSSWVDGVEHNLCKRENILRALSYVYPQYRQCLIMRYMNGSSFSEIAQELNIKEATVRANISYGRKQFIQAYVREMNDATYRDDTAREEGR
jgi:RNA polymerase sigma-70 factor (ECF subfamily)